jgi:hypothetical protein
MSYTVIITFKTSETRMGQRIKDISYTYTYNIINK